MEVDPADQKGHSVQVSDIASGRKEPRERVQVQANRLEGATE